MTMELKEMSMHQLEEMKNAIWTEIDSRRKVQKGAAWVKVREAIAEYLDLCGEIRVETYDTTYQLNNTADLTEIGVFNMEDEC